MNRITFALPLLSGVCFGSIGIFIRLFSEAGFNNMAILSTRNAISALILFVVMYFYDRNLLKCRLRDLPILLGGGFVGMTMTNVFYNIAVLNLSLGFAGVLIGLSPVYVVIIAAFLFKERINFVANPLVNTHLQGRADTYPKRRGITRVKELAEAGINVSFGHDDICDPFYPMGNGSLRDVVFMGLHASQMMGYEDIMNSYRFITENAATTLHITEHYGIEPGKPANFIVMDATNYYEALNQNAPVLYSFRNGNKIAERTPSDMQIYYTAI